jgi:hypothetical protein
MYIPVRFRHLPERAHRTVNPSMQIGTVSKRQTKV